MTGRKSTTTVPWRRPGCLVLMGLLLLGGFTVLDSIVAAATGSTDSKERFSDVTRMVRSDNTTTEKSLIDVRAFGAKGNGVADDTAAIQAAIDSVPTSGMATIYLPSGNYLVTNTITIAKDRINIKGDGKHVSRIRFNPGANGKSVFVFHKGTEVLRQASIRDLGFGMPDANTYTKIGVEAVDTSCLSIENLAFYPWFGGGNSIGIRLRGREATTIRKVDIHADIPISIETNPNYENIDIDHAHFEDTYLTGSKSQACIQIADKVNLTNVTFDGTNAWTTCKHGIYWNDTSGYGASSNLRISNVRFEQRTETESGGYAIYINQHAMLQNLEIENFYKSATNPSSGSSNGIYLRNTSWSRISNYIYASNSGVALDAPDSSNNHLQVQNSLFQSGSTADISAMPNLIRGSDNWVNSGNLNSKLIMNAEGVLSVNGGIRLKADSQPPYACDSAHDGVIALTGLYTTCVCRSGSSQWVLTADGTTACKWGVK